MRNEDPILAFRLGLVRAGLTLIAAIVAYSALDDITTDADSSFALERAALAGCGVWFTVVGWYLMRHGRPVLGGLSLGFVAAAVLAQVALGLGTVPSPWQYLATVGGLAWFVVLGGVLAAWAWRPPNRHAA
jgi:hypothetical protein